MSTARRNDDPLRAPEQALVTPIGSKTDMEGGGTSAFLSAEEPMLDYKGADERMLRDAREEGEKPMTASQHVEAPSSLYCDRMDDKRRCATCGRKTHLRFTLGVLTWFRCRYDHSDTEKAAFQLMLWKDRKRKEEKAYRLQLSTRAEVGQDAA